MKNIPKTVLKKNRHKNENKIKFISVWLSKLYPKFSIKLLNGAPNFVLLKSSPLLMIVIKGNNDPKLKSSKKYLINPTKKSEK